MLPSRNQGPHRDQRAKKYAEDDDILFGDAVRDNQSVLDRKGFHYHRCNAVVRSIMEFIPTVAMAISLVALHEMDKHIQFRFLQSSTLRSRHV